MSGVPGASGPRKDLPGRVTHHSDKACVEDREGANHCLCRIGDYVMAADATEQTTAAKAESAIQAMYRGAGKDRAAVYTGTIEEIGRWSDGSGSVVFRFTFGDHPSAFAGQWPEWAYQVARDAFLYGKQIMVVTPAPPDGQPDGDKLLSVRLVLPLHPPHQDPQPAPRRPLTRKTPAAPSAGADASRSISARPATRTPLVQARPARSESRPAPRSRRRERSGEERIPRADARARDAARVAPARGLPRLPRHQRRRHRRDGRSSRTRVRPAHVTHGLGHPSTRAAAAASTSTSSADHGMNSKTGNFAGANRAPLA